MNLRPLKFDEQVFLLDSEGNRLWLIIEEGPFLTAGKWFHTFSGPGLSANAEAVNFASSHGLEIAVVVLPDYDDRYYVVAGQIWLWETDRLRSTQYRRSVLLRTMPWRLLKTIKEKETVALVLRTYSQQKGLICA